MGRKISDWRERQEKCGRSKNLEIGKNEIAGGARLAAAEEPRATFEYPINPARNRDSKYISRKYNARQSLPLEAIHLDQNCN